MNWTDRRTDQRLNISIQFMRDRGPYFANMKRKHSGRSYTIINYVCKELKLPDSVLVKVVKGLLTRTAARLPNPPLRSPSDNGNFPSKQPIQIRTGRLETQPIKL